MSQRYFCTLFNKEYLIKGVAMLYSLARYCSGAKVFVLCMDTETWKILASLDLPFVSLIPLEEVEDEALIKAKSDRSIAEYCWTLSPCLPWYVFNRYPEINFLTYVDADLLFYSDVKPIFDEIGNSSIAIIEHRFTERLKDREVNGKFCVEWVSFRRDMQGMSCLARWREQCIEWCYYRLEENRMGDQKYLDEWPSRYSECHIIAHPGAGIAPWNYAERKIRSNNQGAIIVDGAPLIFYHFHQFQLLENGRFYRLSSFYTDDCKEPDSIYSIYEYKLQESLSKIRRINPIFSGGLISEFIISKPFFLKRLVRYFMPSFFKKYLRRFIEICRN